MLKKAALVIGMYTLLASAAFSLQIIGHQQLGDFTWRATAQYCDDIGVPKLKGLALPLSGIVTHMASDYFVAEGSLGSWQILRGGIKLATILWTYPEDQRAEEYEITFWNLLPDIIDKGFGVNIFHRMVPDKYLFSFDREQEETIEDMLVARRVWKRLQPPEGTIFSWTVQF